MSEIQRVTIEREQRNRIIYAVLTGYWPADLRQLREDKPDRCEVSDLDIKNFVCNMTASDVEKLRKGRFHAAFLKNAQSAMDRVTAKELKQSAAAKTTK